jgi:hypothetical protein
MTAAGQRIADLDITEISCTPVPVMAPGGHGSTSFAVIDGKAVEYALVEHERANLEWLRDRVRERDKELDQVRVAVARA